MREPQQGSADKVIKIENYCLKAFLLSITNPKSILFHVSFLSSLLIRLPRTLLLLSAFLGLCFRLLAFHGYQFCC